MQANQLPEQTEEREKRRGRWKKAAAIGAFMFFLIKGLLWLVGIYFGSQLFGC